MTAASRLLTSVLQEIDPTKSLFSKGEQFPLEKEYDAFVESTYTKHPSLEKRIPHVVATNLTTIETDLQFFTRLCVARVARSRLYHGDSTSDPFEHKEFGPKECFLSALNTFFLPTTPQTVKLLRKEKKLLGNSCNLCNNHFLYDSKKLLQIIAMLHDPSLYKKKRVIAFLQSYSQIFKVNVPEKSVLLDQIVDKCISLLGKKTFEETIKNSKGTF